ncbi:MAG: hypothetical protein GXO94_09885, partial [Nitrospirae bacterium]|nr:hypothetical protein [Nitrospirota bacterium]
MQAGKKGPLLMGRGTCSLLLFLCMFLAVACARHTRPPEDGFTAIIRRTGGFAGISEEMSIRGDGRGVYTDNRLKTRVTFKVPERDLDLFRRQIESVPPGKTGDPIPDCFIYRITVKDRHGMHHITLYSPSRKRTEHPSVSKLIELLNEWFLIPVQERTNLKQ